MKRTGQLQLDTAGAKRSRRYTSKTEQIATTTTSMSAGGADGGGMDENFDVGGRIIKHEPANSLFVINSLGDDKFPFSIIAAPSE
jgi:hypothetical protein